jgi:hypothetical protein
LVILFAQSELLDAGRDRQVTDQVRRGPGVLFNGHVAERSPDALQLSFNREHFATGEFDRRPT